MIKLTDLLQEQDSFTAINKSSGNVTAFKSKDARDSAVKSGTHDKNKDSEDDDDKKDTPKVNIFKKDKEEPKKDEPKKDTIDYTKLTTTPLVKKTKDDITKVNAVISQFLDKADDIVKNS